MTTLEALGFNVAAGLTLGMASLFGFGIALVNQHEFIAPRCAARPKTVIYRPLHQAENETKKESNNAHPDTDPEDHDNNVPNFPSYPVQDGGNTLSLRLFLSSISESFSRFSSLLSSWFDPLVGWIGWTLSLSYETMLQGIPGTGTRQEGASGALLCCNLDMIVLLRFHALGSKLSAVATLCCLLVLLPLYWNSDCYQWNQQQQEQNHYFSNNNNSVSYPFVFETSVTAASNNIDWHQEACSFRQTDHPLTGYERTTIANVPTYLSDEERIKNFLPSKDSYPYRNRRKTSSLSLSSSFNSQRQEQEEQPSGENGDEDSYDYSYPEEYDQTQTLVRLYAAVFTIWILTFYGLNLLKREWIELLALRRVYYLEANVWKEQRNKQAKRKQRTTPNESKQQRRGGEPQPPQDEGETNSRQGKEPHLLNRDPWIPHPEQRDTVSNIQLYSVLVGGLPSLPDFTHLANNHHPPASATTSHSNTTTTMMDWQLALTTAFFDHCVPNQPGYSSSVAAVTLLPSSKSIAMAWSRWYKAAAKLRRWQLIQQQIQKRMVVLQQEQEERDSKRKEHHDNNPNDFVHIHLKSNSKDGRRREDDEDDDEEMCIELESRTVSAHSGRNNEFLEQFQLEYGSPQVSEGEAQRQCSMEGNYPYYSWSDHKNNGRSGDHPHHDNEIEEHVFQSLLRENESNRFSTTSHHNNNDPPPPDGHDVDNDEDQFMFFLGPEQTAIYSREVAQSAAACCPYGCREGAIVHATMDELLELEQDAAAQVHEANVELYKARQQAIQYHYQQHQPKQQYHHRNTLMSSLPSHQEQQVEPRQEYQQQTLHDERRIPTLLPKASANSQNIFPHNQNNEIHQTQTKHHNFIYNREGQQKEDEQQPQKGRYRLSSLVSSRKSMEQKPIPRMIQTATKTNQAIRTSSPTTTATNNYANINPALWKRNTNNMMVVGDSTAVQTFTTATNTPMVPGGNSIQASEQQEHQSVQSWLPTSWQQQQLSQNDVPLGCDDSDWGFLTPPEIDITGFISSMFSNTAVSSIAPPSRQNMTATSATATSLQCPPTISRAQSAPSPVAVNGDTTATTPRDRLPSDLELEGELLFQNKATATAVVPTAARTATPANRPDVPKVPSSSSFVETRRLQQQQQHPLPYQGRLHRRIGSFPSPATTATTIPKMSQPPQTSKEERQQPYWFPREDHKTTREGVTEESSSPRSHGMKKLKKNRRKKRDSSNTSEEKKHDTVDLVPSSIAEKQSEMDSQIQVRRSGSSSTKDSLSLDESDEEQANTPMADMSLDESNNSIIATSAGPEEKAEPSKWEKVQSIVTSTRKAMYSTRQRELQHETAKRSFPNHYTAISGVWKWPSCLDLLISVQGRIKSATKFLTKQSEVMDLSQESSYAVVTFTSRQAALAARHCLADARGGTDRWKTDEELPIPPLADAAAWDLCVCRNCCRPVAITIDSRQKLWRHYLAILLLAAFYALSAFPLTLVAGVMDPKNLEQAFPNFFQWANRNQDGTAELMSGFFQSLLWTTFFALCPVFFKTVANFGSNANSVANAELRALQYFWWFMVVSAFSSTLIANMILFGFNEGNLGGEVRAVLRSIARAIPSTTAATWLNWIIFRTTVTLPALYLLQINSFFWDLFGFRCCSRLSRGGGPGPPPPYRLYVDSGVVLMCLLGLSTASPLVAPASFVYFIWCQPILRRCCIFVYRPKYDGGGLRWPFIFDMVVSSFLVGQVLLTVQMVLKQAVGPAVAAAMPILPTLLSAMNMKKKFLRAFRDVALLQTSLLDGWDSSSMEMSTMEQREEFRRFLVDAHRAAYIPVCLAHTNPKDQHEMSMTAEPAVVVPMETDIVRDLLHTYGDHEFVYDQDMAAMNDEASFGRQSESEGAGGGGGASAVASWNVLERRDHQYGGTLRRAEKTLSALRLRTPSKASVSSSSESQSRSKRGSVDFTTENGGGPTDSLLDNTGNSTKQREYKSK